MSELSRKAEPAAKRLLQMDEEQLYQQLGLTMDALRENVAIASDFDPSVPYNESMMGTLDSFINLGKRIFKRWNSEAHQLLCGHNAEDDAQRNELMDAIGIGEVATCAALAGILVSSFGLAAPVATLLAAILVKRFFRATYEEVCKAWGEAL